MLFVLLLQAEATFLPNVRYPGELGAWWGRASEGDAGDDMWFVGPLQAARQARLSF